MINSCEQIGIQDATELNIMPFASAPDYFLAVDNVIDKQSGDIVPEIMLVQGQAVMPNGSSVNQFPLEANNPTLTVPEGQVVPAYVQAAQTNNAVLMADSAEHADFLVVSVEAGLATCQSTGVIFFPQGHQYTVTGAQYYLSSTPGQVTTNSAETGRKLFKVISRTQLLINM